MVVKFIASDGQGDTANAVRSIDYAIQHGARVLSNSWGGEGDANDADNKPLKDAIERARDKGVLFIAAAGNGGQDGQGDNNDTGPHIAFPASFDSDNIISVAATDNNDALASFSNYGAQSVDLGAPGVNVFSTNPQNQYDTKSGTSMACPHVAGAAALLWSKHPTWTYAQVKKTLLDSVDLLPGLKGKTLSGGRLNVLKALQSKE